MVEDIKHCDDYIDDPSAPECLRAFLSHTRSPAHGMHLGEKPPLFATYGGRRYRVVMASRLGDVGITTNLEANHGYEKRVSVCTLSDLSSTPLADSAERGEG